MASVTYSRNRYGQYTRARVAPDQTSTARRLVARSDFATAVGAWSGVLSESQRVAWNEFALRPATRDSLGARSRLSGQSLYIEAAISSVHHNGGVWDLSPPEMIVWRLIVSDLQWALGAWNLYWSDDCQVQIDVTSSPGSSGSYYLPPRDTWWVSWTSLNAGAGSPIGIRGSYPAVPSGEVVGVRLRQWSGDAVLGSCGFYGAPLHWRLVAP